MTPSSEPRQVSSNKPFAKVDKKLFAKQRKIIQKKIFAKPGNDQFWSFGQAYQENIS